MMRKPVIARTRIAVELVLEKLAAGETVERYFRSTPANARGYSGSAGFRSGAAN